MNKGWYRIDPNNQYFFNGVFIMKEHQNQGQNVASAKKEQTVFLLTANGAAIREGEKTLCYSRLSDAETKLRERAGNAKAEIKPSATGWKITGHDRERIKTISVL